MDTGAIGQKVAPYSYHPWAAEFPNLCTKKVTIALLEQYLGQLNVYFNSGRAAVAKQLHAEREHDLARAHPVVGPLLPGKLGGQSGRVIAALGAGDSLIKVVCSSYLRSSATQAESKR